MRTLKFTAIALCLILLGGCSSQPTPPNWIEEAMLIPGLPDVPLLEDRWNDQEYAGALHYEGVWSIRSGSRSSGEYHYELFVGQTNQFIVISAKVSPLGPNPYSAPGGRTYGDAIVVLRDAGENETIRPPASYHSFQYFRGGGDGFPTGYWRGTDWAARNQPDEAELKEEGNRPVRGTNGVIWHEGTTTFWKMAIDKQADAAPGLFNVQNEPWFRMAVMFQRLGPSDLKASFFDPKYSDVAPGVGYSPNDMFQPETWWKFRLE